MPIKIVDRTDCMIYEQTRPFQYIPIYSKVTCLRLSSALLILGMPSCHPSLCLTAWIQFIHISIMTIILPGSFKCKRQRRYERCLPWPFLSVPIPLPSISIVSFLNSTPRSMMGRIGWEGPSLQATRMPFLGCDSSHVRGLRGSTHQGDSSHVRVKRVC
jgi:hypothetical protein